MLARITCGQEKMPKYLMYMQFVRASEKVIIKYITKVGFMGLTIFKSNFLRIDY